MTSKIEIGTNLQEKHKLKRLKPPINNGILEGFRMRVGEKGKLLEPMESGRYLEEVFRGQRGVHTNSAELIHNAITTPDPIVDESGIKEYPFFSQRQDGLAVLGCEWAIEKIAAFFARAEQSGGKETILVLVGPSGGGKSNIVDAITKGMEDFTREHPLDTIQGCPINESPLNLLDKEAREKAKEYGIKVEGKLCPHCEDNLEKAGNNPFALDVKPAVLSASRGIGIGELDPQLTRGEDAASKNRINKVILSSGGGILEIPELYRHPDEFLMTLNDLARGRTWQTEDGIFNIDVQIVAHTTYEEWQGLCADRRLQSLVNRTEVVFLPYILSTKDEREIYEKFLGKSRIKTHKEGEQEESIHISKKTLEFLAEVAVRSRLLESTSGITKDQKVKLYNGEKVDGYNMREIQEEGARGKEKEGITVGVSPEFMRVKINVLLERAKKNCLNPITALTELHALVKEEPFEERSVLEPQIMKVREQAEEWLKETIEKAFRGKHEEACQKIWEEYIENLDLYFLEKTKTDPHTKEEIGPDIKLMREIEKIAFPEITSYTEIRRQYGDKTESVYLLDSYRTEIFRTYGNNNKGDKPNSVREVDEAILKIVTGSSEAPAEILSAINNPSTLSPEQTKRLNEVNDILIENHGFCSCCSKDLITYAAKRDLLGKKGK